MNCSNVDSSIDNQLTRSNHVNTHSYFHKCIDFHASNANYRHYYIGLLGDNTANNNQFVIAGDGGGGNDPNIITAFDDGGNVYMANNLYLDQTLECNQVTFSDGNQTNAFTSSLKSNLDSNTIKLTDVSYTSGTTTISNNLNVNGDIDLTTSGKKLIFPDDTEQTTAFRSTYDAYNNQSVLNGLSFSSGIQYNPFTLQHEILLDNISYKVLERGLKEYNYPNNAIISDLYPTLSDLTEYGDATTYTYTHFYDLALPGTLYFLPPPVFNDPPSNPIPDVLIPTVPDFHRPGNNNNGGGDLLPEVPNPTGQPFTITAPPYDNDVITSGKLVKIGWYEIIYEGQADGMNWVNAFLGRIEIKDSSDTLIKTSFWAGRNIGGGGDDITVSFRTSINFYADTENEYRVNFNTKYWFGTQTNAEVIVV